MRPTRAEQPDISVYNKFTTDAARAEREGNYEYARKLWDESSVIAEKRNWRAKLNWCEARIAFCDRQIKLQRKRK